MAAGQSRARICRPTCSRFTRNLSELPVPDHHGGTHHTMPPLKTGDDYTAYIRARTNAWKASRGGKASTAHSH